MFLAFLYIFAIKCNVFFLIDNPRGLKDNTVMDKIEQANEGKILGRKTTKFLWYCNDVPMLLLASSPFMARMERRAHRERKREWGANPRGTWRWHLATPPTPPPPQMERFDRRLTPFTLGLCRTNHNGPLAAIFTLSSGLREEPWERGCPFQ